MNKKIMKNFAEVVISNITTILSGIVVSFIIPKILTVEDYGSYKTFTLYLSYIGFFHLGIIDGIVLKYGGCNYDEINKEKFRSFFSWYFLIQVLFSIIIIIISVICLKKSDQLIGVFVAIDMIAINITTYYQQLSQITQRFEEYSLRKILQSIFNVLSVSILFFLFNKGIDVGYELYISIILFINICLCLWYIYTYKSLTFGKSYTLFETGEEIITLIKIGFPLLFANLCTSLILTVDKQFVSILFDKSTFAIYSFAYNMLSLVTVATSAVAAVLYPTLMRTKKERLKNMYDSLIVAMLSFVFLALSLYFPLVAFVQWFLPKYNESLIIFRIIFPGLAVSSCITVIIHNYYKVIGENLKFFRKSVVVLVFSCIANAIAYLFFRTTASISIASIVSIIFWYLYIEEEFVKLFNYYRWKNVFYIFLSMLGFYFFTCFKNWGLGFSLYIIYILIITITMNMRSIKKLINCFL